MLRRLKKLTNRQVYSTQITVQLDKGGTAQLDYYSEESNGQQESVKAEVLQ